DRRPLRQGGVPLRPGDDAGAGAPLRDGPDDTPPDHRRSRGGRRGVYGEEGAALSGTIGTPGPASPAGFGGTGGGAPVRRGLGNRPGSPGQGMYRGQSPRPEGVGEPPGEGQPGFSKSKQSPGSGAPAEGDWLGAKAADDNAPKIWRN